ncbi:MAG: hypothetical protein WD226_07470 [Planctomycetota bacterium]
MRPLHTLPFVLAACLAPPSTLGAQSPPIENPILFCTQVPNPRNYLTITSTFGTHRAKPHAAVRGGDLMIRYPDGSLRNLTREAGFGEPGIMQGADAIAVREPTVHWSGTRALFSMIDGAPIVGTDPDLRWQIYEVQGLGQGQQVAIYRVPGQPSLYNNVSPFYLSNGRVGFTSDRPRNGAPHLYPQLDEYEEAPTNTGIWSIDPFGAPNLQLLTHTPSGAFRPSLDSFGRIIYTRWDHLERDQQTDLELMGLGNYGTFNYSDESAFAYDTGSNFEWFPEPRSQWIGFVTATPGYGGPLNGYTDFYVGNDFNHFLPWQLRQDGTGEETVNHIGRHELFDSFARSRNDDPDLQNFGQFASWVKNRNPIDGLHQIREDPNVQGLYYAIDCRNFDTHAAGQIVTFYAPAGDAAHEVDVQYVTHRETADPTLTPSVNHSGLYRSPLRTSNGVGIAVHTPNTAKDTETGGMYGGVYWPSSSYEFRLKRLWFDGVHWRAGATLTPGIPRIVAWGDPWNWRAWFGTLWELDPVEVVARPMPPVTGMPPLEAPEAVALASTGVSTGALRSYLAQNDLALMVVRDATTRDAGDRQQPFNLRVAQSGHQSTSNNPAALWNVSHLQLFQADQIRSLTFGGSLPVLGRRPLAQPMHDAPIRPSGGAPAGGVEIAADGSVAALVPARRAMSWQLTAPSGDPVVSERYWLTFQPGEIRSCGGCHGVNDHDQTGQGPAANPPQALTQLVQWLQSQGQL